MVHEPNCSTAESAATSRREFLGQAATLTVAAAGGIAEAAAVPAESLPKLLPTVALGPHKVTRLILGGNPIYGYSHFNRLYSQHMIDYHTPERVAELLRAATNAGINTWQNSYADRTVEDVRRCREAGIPFHWLLLGKPDWVQRPAVIEEAAAHKPLGMAPHGALAERLHREGNTKLLLDLLKRIRQTGVLVGLSAHDPRLIALAVEQNWDVDYFMCCLYYLTRPKDEFQQMLQHVPLGEIYLPDDRERMLKAIAAAPKPCLAYKVFAAGRTDLSPTGVRRTFQQTLATIKPNDAMIVGMFQEFGDQVGMNAQIVRELAGAPRS